MWPLSEGAAADGQEDKRRVKRDDDDDDNWPPRRTNAASHQLTCAQVREKVGMGGDGKMRIDRDKEGKGGVSIFWRLFARVLKGVSLGPGKF